MAHSDRAQVQTAKSCPRAATRIAKLALELPPELPDGACELSADLGCCLHARMVTWHAATWAQDSLGSRRTPWSATAPKAKAKVKTAAKVKAKARCARLAAPALAAAPAVRRQRLAEEAAPGIV